MQFLTTAQNWILKGLVFLLPLFILPFTSDFIELNKLALLVTVAIVSLFIWSVGQTKSDFKLRVTPFDLPVLVFAAVMFASSLIMTPNRYDAFVAPGTTSIILAGTVLYFVLTQYFRNSEESEGLWDWLLLGGAVSALIAAFAGIGGFAQVDKYLNLPDWMVQNTFNTLGGVLPAAAYFIALIPVGLGRMGARRPLAVGLCLALIIGIAVLAYWAVPGKPTSPVLLPFATGWSIALETLKQSPLLGVGPGNFVEAFSRFRPVDFNASSVWTLRFNVSSNWFFHVWTVSGILGLIAFLWITTVAVKEIRSGGKSFVHAGLAVLLILFTLIPVNLLLLTLFFISLAYVGSKRGHDISLHFAAQDTDFGGSPRTNLVPGIIAIAALILGGLVAYFGVPVYLADVHFRNALEGYVARDSKKVGDEILAAIRANPRVDSYRTFYGRVALESANVRAADPDLTDEDRQVISQLIQLAISESRAAVSVNQNRSQNWSNLASTYQAIMPFAKDADRFTIASYQQAIALDPTNPVLRVSFGGVLYALKNYEEAVKAFELAVSAKQDYANAHYNLAIALRDKGDLARAAQELAIVRRLVPEGSTDAEVAQKDYDAITAKLKEQATPSAQQKTGEITGEQPPLQAPKEQQRVIDPPIDLPEDSAPPATSTEEETNPTQQPQ